MTSLIPRVQSLIDYRQRIGQPIDHHFLPGLSHDEIQQRLASYPIYISDELIELYTWHNGTREEDFLLFRDMAWLSLENAIANYEQMHQYFWSMLDPSETRLEPAQMFPFAGFNGMFLYLSYPGQTVCPQADLPIIAVGEGELSPYFTSLLSLLETVNEWFSVGQHTDYGCEVAPDVELEIWRNYNGDVLQF